MSHGMSLLHIYVVKGGDKTMNLGNSYCNASQAARILNISRNTLWLWAKKGKIKVEKIGHNSLISKEEIRRLEISKKSPKNEV